MEEFLPSYTEEIVLEVEPKLANVVRVELGRLMIMTTIRGTKQRVKRWNTRYLRFTLWRKSGSLRVWSI
jgi:hypothetical protein